VVSIVFEPAMKRVTISDLRRRTAEILADLDRGPVIVSRRGRRAAVLLGAHDFEEIQKAREEAERPRVTEVVRAGLTSHAAGRTVPHSAVVRLIRASRARRK
jgi:prevent-host-death family protein